MIKIICNGDVRKQSESVFNREQKLLNFHHNQPKPNPIAINISSVATICWINLRVTFLSNLFPIKAPMMAEIVVSSRSVKLSF